jgi:hypothetical protein
LFQKDGRLTRALRAEEAIAARDIFDYLRIPRISFTIKNFVVDSTGCNCYKNLLNAGLIPKKVAPAEGDTAMISE